MKRRPTLYTPLLVACGNDMAELLFELASAHTHEDVTRLHDRAQDMMDRIGWGDALRELYADRNAELDRKIALARQEGA